MLHVPSGTARVGQMYDIAYQVVNSDQVVTVSTTRPETILGDVAVAVHPSDPRYTSLLNEKVLLKHPLREDLIPLIADADGVDPELGTGAVKITPNHDFNDFKIAQRLSLPSSIIIMDGKGNMTFPDETESPFQLTPDGKTFLVRRGACCLFSSAQLTLSRRCMPEASSAFIIILLPVDQLFIGFTGITPLPSSTQGLKLFGKQEPTCSSSRSPHVSANL